ncbi:MAG: type II secretion system F family protein [Planctomycetota bacterium]
MRTRRRKRVEDVERELPIVLELLATMSESGVGFDGALDRVLASRERQSPLVSELRTFQTESLAGHGRVACFRRLSARLAVPSVSIFTSALVHAERLGAGYSSVLRTQADDLRKRRRERANTAAQALPVKLVFPLILCFLPGIFVTTLGPAALEFLRMADQFMHH